MRDLVYYIAVSVDGFIADGDGDPSAFPQTPETLHDLFERYPETCPVQARALLGITAAPRRFDTVVMGYRTYEHALKAGLVSPYPHLQQIVATHHELPENAPVEVISGDVAGRIADLKREPGDDIWLCGGADLAGRLIDEIDEIQVKVNPILMGQGIPLFSLTGGPRSLAFVGSTPLPGGVLLNTYRRV